MNTHLNYKNKVSPFDTILTNLLEIGGANFKIELSEDEKHIYAIGQAGGFYIINIENKQKPFIVSNFSKSKTKFGQYSNGAFGPLNRSIYDLKGDYAYNKPFDFVLSKDKKKAYIVDFIHGFYVLNIEDKKNPILLNTFKEIKAISIDISSDGKQLIIPILDVQKGIMKLAVFNTEKLNSYKISKSFAVEKDNVPNAALKSHFISAPVKVKYLPNIQKVFISYKHKLIKYDLLEDKIVNEIKTAGYITSITLSSKNDLIYLSFSHAIAIYQRKNMDYVNHIDLDGSSMRFCILSKGDSQLYTNSRSQGTIKLDVSDINNPEKLIGYKVMGHNSGAVDAIISKDKEYLYLSIGASLGIVKL